MMITASILILLVVLLSFIILQVDAWKLTRGNPPNLRKAQFSFRKFLLPVKNNKGDYYEATIVHKKNEEFEDTDLEIFVPVALPITDSELNSLLLKEIKNFTL